MRGLVALVKRLLYYRLLGPVKRRRAERFLEVMRPRPGDLLLDVGGGQGDWWYVFVPSELKSDARVVSIDLQAPSTPRAGVFFVCGDATTLPFGDRTFDVAFSNSVLEHVGDLAAQLKYASEIRRVATRYFVQVPNKHFPVEPHLLIPFAQYLPVSLQRALARRLLDLDEEIHLPDRRRLKFLFPAATIESERFLGLTKAFYIWENPIHLDLTAPTPKA